MQIKTNQCMTDQKVKMKEKINLPHAWSAKPVTEPVIE